MEDNIAELILKYPTKENTRDLIKALRNDPKVLSSAKSQSLNLRPGVWKYLLLHARNVPSATSPPPATATAATATTPSSVEFVNLATDEGTEEIHTVCQGCDLIRTLHPDTADQLCARLESVTRIMRGGVRGTGSDALLSQRLASLPYTRSHSDIAAPFVCLGMSEGDAATCALALLESYAPFAAAQDTAFVERALCELIRLLLYYQDPALGFFVEQRGASLYPLLARWFRGLFSASAKGELLLRLWDYILILRDPAFFVFLCLAVLLEARSAIVACKTNVQLDELLGAFRFGSEAALDKAVNSAYRLTRAAPLSVRKQVLGVVTRCESARAWIRANILGSPCLHTSVLDLLQDKHAGRIVFVVDCRPDGDVARGTLPTAYPLPATVLTDEPARFADALAAIKALRDATPDIHFALCGVGGTGQKEVGAAELTALVYKLLREGIPHLSLIQNGFAGVHAFAMEGKLELCDHKPEACPICLGNRSIFAKGLASLRDTAYQTFVMLSPSIEAAREKATLAVSQTMAMIEERTKSARAARQPQQEQEEQQQQQTSSAAKTGDSKETTLLSSPEVKKPAESNTSATTKKMEVPSEEKTNVKSIVEETKAPLPDPSTEEGMFTIEGDDDDDDDDSIKVKVDTSNNTSGGVKENDKGSEEMMEKKKEGEEEEKRDGGDDDDEEDSISFGGDDGFDSMAPMEKDDSADKLASQGYAAVHTWMTKYSSIWEVVTLKADGSEDATAAAGLVAVADDAIVFLEKHPQHPTHARIRKEYPLTSIDKINTRKTNPKHNILRFKDASARPEQFLINDPQELIKAVKQALTKN